MGFLASLVLFVSYIGVCSAAVTCSALNSDGWCVINCGNICKETTVYCTADAPCQIICDSDDACKGSSISAASATDVVISCVANGDSESCKELSLSCGSGDCSLQCESGESENCKEPEFVYTASASSFTCTGTCWEFASYVFTATPSSSPTRSDPITSSPTSTAPTTSPSTTLPPTLNPTKFPSPAPSSYPTSAPSAYPTLIPTESPSVRPTPNPTGMLIVNDLIANDHDTNTGEAANDGVADIVTTTNLQIGNTEERAITPGWVLITLGFAFGALCCCFAGIHLDFVQGLKMFTKNFRISTEKKSTSLGMAQIRGMPQRFCKMTGF